MVLILAAEWDPLALALREELRRRGRDHAVLGEDWAQAAELVWTPAPFGGSLRLDGRRVDLASLRGVLARHELLMRLPGTLEAADERYPYFEGAATLLALLDALPCPVVNRPRPAPPSRAALAAPARAAGFEPMPAVIATRRDDALAAVATDGRPTLVGRVSYAGEDRVVAEPETAAEAVDALLPHGAVMVRTLAPVPLTTALVAGEAVIGATGELRPAVASAARDLAGRLGVQLVSITLQQGDGRLWFVDANLHPLAPGGADDALLAPAARGLADVFEAAA